MQAKARKGGQWRGFVEHVEVSDRELLSHAVRHFKSGLLVLWAIVVRTNLDGPAADLAFD